MRQVLIVSYDLAMPGQNYERLLKRIKEYKEWARLGGSAYLVYTDNGPVQVRDYLSPALDQNDQLYVGVAPAPAAWIGMPEDVSQWIQARQK